MKRIDTTTAVPDMFGPGKSGWRNGNKAQGIPATEFNADWPNNVQEEICNVIEAAGITLDGNNRAQLLQAIRGIIAGKLATEKVAGIARIATAEEAEAGEDNATIITPAKLANALKSIQGNYKDVFSIETSTQLDDTHFGSLIFAGYDTPGVVITLPQSNAAAKGKKITLSSNRAGVTISPYAGDYIRFGNFTNTENGFFLPGFSVVTLVSNGNMNWTVVSEIESGAVGSSGYKRYPNGLLVQWAADTRNVSGGMTTTNFNFPYKNTPFIIMSAFNADRGGNSHVCLTNRQPTYFEWAAFYENKLVPNALGVGCYWMAIGEGA